MDQQDIPSFEGRPVEGVTTTIGGGSADDLDIVVSIDDVIQVLSIYKCTNVHHNVDKDGHLIRVQVLKLQEAATKPFNELDPNDDGVVRLLGKPGRAQVAMNAPAAAFSGAATDVDEDGDE